MTTDAPRPNTIRLTQQEVEMAKMLEIPLHEYAWHKLKLMKEQEEYEKWLQTPAGQAHMEKKLAQRERQLAKWRAYSREYRKRKKLTA